MQLKYQVCLIDIARMSVERARIWLLTLKRWSNMVEDLLQYSWYPFRQTLPTWICLAIIAIVAITVVGLIPTQVRQAWHLLPRY